jgi:ADP-heptose:LPS heptosyltransferase
VKRETVALSFIDHPANLVLQSMRTSKGWRKRVLLSALAVFALLQVTLAWLCFLFLLLVRWAGHQRHATKQVLIIAMGGIGDDVLAISFIKALKRSYPTHTISVIIRPVAVGFSELLPSEIDRELPYRFGTTPTSRLLEPFRALRFVLHHGLANNTELAVVPNWGPDVCGAGFIAFFSRGIRRITFASVSEEKKVRNFLYGTLYTSQFHIRAEMHERDKLDFLLQQSLGPETEFCNVERPLVSESRSRSPTVLVAPFTGHPRKNWPVERWIAVIRELTLSHPDAEFVIIGGPGDHATAETIARGCPQAINLCGKLSFPDVVGLARASSVFVGGDTGFTHLAAYAEASIVVLFSHPVGGSPGHYYSPVRFAPVAKHVTVLQPEPNPGCAVACEALKACCILNISVRDVVLAAENALGRFQPAAQKSATGNYAIQ